MTGRRWTGMLAGLVVASALGTGAAAAAGTESLRLALGKQDFETYCASCHGESAAGDGPVAEFLALEAADLTGLARKYGGKFPVEQVERVIDGRDVVKVHGPRDMPVWGDWFDSEAQQPGLRPEEREMVVRERIAAITSYLETLQKK